MNRCGCAHFGVEHLASSLDFLFLFLARGSLLSRGATALSTVPSRASWSVAVERATQPAIVCVLRAATEPVGIAGRLMRVPLREVHRRRPLFRTHAFRLFFDPVPPSCAVSILELISHTHEGVDLSDANYTLNGALDSAGGNSPPRLRQPARTLGPAAPLPPHAAPAAPASSPPVQRQLSQGGRRVVMHTRGGRATSPPPCVGL